MAALPESARALLRGRAYAHLVTRGPRGAPQLSMVWADADGDEVLINTAEGRVKVRNVRNDPRVALSVQHHADPQNYLLIHGRVTAIEHEGADAHVDMLARRFLGADAYPYRAPGERRVVLRVAADRIGGMGEWAPPPGAPPPAGGAPGAG